MSARVIATLGAVSILAAATSLADPGSLACLAVVLALVTATALIVHEGRFGLEVSVGPCAGRVAQVRSAQGTSAAARLAVFTVSRR